MDDLDPSSVLDMAVVEALRGLDADGEDELFTELVSLFVDDAARLVAQIEAALSTGDAATLERSAHTLKSSSASLGAARLSEVCFELEKRGRARDLEGAGSLVQETGEAYRRACRALESLRA